VTFSAYQHPQRGYIANILTIPPLIYPFQYNPTQITDSKNLQWGVRRPRPLEDAQTALTAVAGGNIAALGTAVSVGIEHLGSLFSNADLHEFAKEGDRTISFKFVVDGREQRPDEPARRREDGTIRGDLAIIRSFTYPKMLNVVALLTALSTSEAEPFSTFFFNSPPTMTLIMGDMIVEGFVTDLRITEQQFNQDLNPVRAEIEVTMIEKIDSLWFILDSAKRIGRTFYYTAYEDIGKMLF
jgi:hypothetical protein